MNQTNFSRRRRHRWLGSSLVAATAALAAGFISGNATAPDSAADKPGRPMIGLGNQGGGKDDVSGFSVHSF